MTDWKVPLADVVLRDDELEAIVEVYRSGWLSMGPRTEELEAALAGYAGVRFALACASGTAALHLLCSAAGLVPGDEVIMPSMTFVATANAVAYTGARPVFADIESLDRPWLSVDAAERAIGPRTRAIMSMAYGGRSGAAGALRELADERGLVLLEDAAHAIGGRLGERQIGTFGAAGAFSFFSNKNLPVGEGGAVVTDDPDLAARMRLLRSHGMTTLTWDRHRGHASGYDVVALGFNYRLDEPRAALATARLRRLDADNRLRADVVRRYRERLAGVPGVMLPAEPEPGERPAHHLFAVVVEQGLDRDAFRAELAGRGVQTSVHYPPVHRFSIYSQGAPDLPVTDAYGRRTVTLPLFAHMSGAQVEHVIAAVREAAGRVSRA